MADIEYTFKIDVFTPATLPMKRLAEYLWELSRLYGNHESVHFAELKKGSTVIVKHVEFEAEPKVRDRLDGVRHRDAPAEAIDAYTSIDKMLAEDNAVGTIGVVRSRRKTAQILEFPGRTRASIERFGPVTQSGTIDGQLIRIGGLDETVPVLLLEEDHHRYCNCNRETARKLAPFLFGTMLRVFGNGKWHRDDFGNWVMDRFSISDFKPLDETPLLDITADLRSIKTDLQKIDDPLLRLRQLRNGT